MNIALLIIVVVVLCFGFVVFRGAPYVPTLRRQLKTVFTELYPLGEKDLLVDIGSGDGVVLRKAAEYKARALGYELNPLLYVLSKALSTGNNDIQVKCVDAWRQTLPAETTVVYGFMEQHYLNRTKKYLQAQSSIRSKPLYFISYGFQLPDMKYTKKHGPFFLYQFK